MVWGMVRMMMKAVEGTVSATVIVMEDEEPEERSHTF